MSFRALWTFVLFTLSCCSVWAADAGPGHLVDLARFLDKATPNEQRQAIFTAWRDSALKGDAGAQYVVGSIYRRGDNVVPHVAERDADQARRFLSTAAAHGRLLAMAKMAELELSENHAQEAMIWAQVYGCYCGWAGTANPADYGKNNEHQPTMYYEDLLRRVSARLGPKIDEQKATELGQQANAFVAAHDADIRAQQWRFGVSPTWTGKSSKLVNGKDFHRVGIPLGVRSIVSEWTLDFAADGSVARAVPFDAIPNFIEASSYHGLVSQYEIAAADKSQDARYVFRAIDLRKADWPLGPTVTR